MSPAAIDAVKGSKSLSALEQLVGGSCTVGRARIRYNWKQTWGKVMNFLYEQHVGLFINGGALFIIHFRLGPSIINHPAIGIPPWLWQPMLAQCSCIPAEPAISQPFDQLYTRYIGIFNINWSCIYIYIYYIHNCTTAQTHSANKHLVLKNVYSYNELYHIISIFHYMYKKIVGYILQYTFCTS